MGLEWVLVGLLVAVTLWLGMDACRESKRLHARLTRVAVRRPASSEPHGAPARKYQALAAVAKDRVGSP